MVGAKPLAATCAPGSVGITCWSMPLSSYIQRKQDSQYRKLKLTQKKEPINTKEDVATTPSLISSAARPLRLLPPVVLATEVAISAAFLDRDFPTAAAAVATILAAQYGSGKVITCTAFTLKESGLGVDAPAITLSHA